MLKNPQAEHVRVLWRMKKDMRAQMWRSLGRFEEVTELELGGESGCECPMDHEELLMLLPEGRKVLEGLRGLVLRWCSRKLDDAFLEALHSASCGAKLAWLTLWSE